ncbi:MAG TPA: phosphotransferase [Roseiflexaceae bacterium]|nr:phosphotransferase [Roseiflexaceae bacterium]
MPDILTPADLPPALRSLVGPVQRIDYPPQGDTSLVASLEGANGAAVLKRAHRVPFDAWLRREHAVLHALEATPLAVPRPLALAEHGGAVWLLMTRLPGEPLRAVLRREQRPAKRRVLLRGFGAAVAALHRCPAPPGLTPPAPEGWLASALRQAGEALERHPVDGTPELLDRLRASIPAPVPQTLIHGDCTLDNVLVEGGRISGLIDWAGGAVGDPRYDLALATQPKPEAFGNPDDQDAFYSGYNGPRLEANEADFFLGLYEFF